MVFMSHSAHTVNTSPQVFSPKLQCLVMHHTVRDMTESSVSLVFVKRVQMSEMYRSPKVM